MRDQNKKAVLALIETFPGISKAKLAMLMERSHNNIGQYLKSLSDEGLIKAYTYPQSAYRGSAYREKQWFLAKTGDLQVKENLKCAWKVTAGILRATPVVEVTREFGISEEEYNSDLKKEIFNSRMVEAMRYAESLHSPERFNWVLIQWVCNQ